VERIRHKVHTKTEYAGKARWQTIFTEIIDKGQIII